jgi:hypothetical protein
MTTPLGKKDAQREFIEYIDTSFHYELNPKNDFKTISKENGLILCICSVKPLQTKSPQFALRAFCL